MNLAQKKIIIETVKSWPATLGSRELLERLDTMAKAILEAQDYHTVVFNAIAPFVNATNSIRMADIRDAVVKALKEQ